MNLRRALLSLILSVLFLSSALPALSSAQAEVRSPAEASIVLRPGQHPALTVEGNQPFLVQGAGFVPGEVVLFEATFTLFSGGRVLLTRQSVADRAGVTQTFGLSAPADTRSGPVTLTARGTRSGRTAAGVIYVAYHPEVTLSPQSAAAGGTVTASVSGFAPYDTIQVSVTVSTTNGQAEAVVRAGTADGKGNGSISLTLPSQTGPGQYRVEASQSKTRLAAAAVLTVAAPLHLSVQPSVVSPGQAVAITGSGFLPNTAVRVTARVPVAGGSIVPSVTVTANASGAFALSYAIPGNAIPGSVQFVAQGANGQATATLAIRSAPAPRPTSAPTYVPPMPPTRHTKFGFAWVSVWYHTVRLGSWQHIEMQAKAHHRFSLWVIVSLPSAGRYAWYTRTGPQGFWGKTFYIPTDALVGPDNQAIVLFELWKGKHHKRKIRTFTIVR